MRKIAFLILLFFMISCTNKKQVKIATFNARYYNSNEVENSWETRVSSMQSFFNKEDFDIIGMQEVTHYQILDLQKRLPHYEYVGKGQADGHEGGEYCPIFYKKDKYTLLAKSQFWLSETPETPGSINWEGLFPRIVTWVKLENNKTGYIFFVFNTQFCHISEFAREKSAILILKKINEIADYAPVILTGDFNMQKDSKPYLILTSNWDRFISLINSEELDNKFENKDSTTCNNFSSNSPSHKTDFIFVNGYLSVSKYKVHIVKQKTFSISDNYPVSATLNFLFERRFRHGKLLDEPWQ